MFLLHALLVITPILAATQVPLSDYTVSSASASDFGAYVAKVGNAFKVPGLSVSVVRKGEAPEYYTWGKRSEVGDPVTPDTMFSIGSCSKAFTAISMGLLMDDFKHGRNVTALPAGVEFDWTTKVIDLLPGEWKLMDDWATSKADLLDIFSHVTGLNRHDFSYNTDLGLDELVHNLRYLRPSYEFRVQWQYNNLMYATGAYIVGKYAGQPYPKFVMDRIFSPLGMTQATYYPQQPYDAGNLAELWVQQAGPYFNETRLVPYFLQDWSDEAVEAFLSGAGGVIASIRDLSIWVSTLLNNGAHPETGEQIIPTEVLAIVMAGRSAMPPLAEYPEHSPWVYGAGWWRVSDRGHEFVQHGGTVTGSSTWITLIPNDDLAIVTLVNGNGQHKALQALTGRVVEDTFGLEHVDWIGRFLNTSEIELKERQQSKYTVSPDSSSSLDSFAGTYYNPGYIGNFTLCAWPAEPGSDCEEVLEGYSITDSAFETEKSHSLYARWNRFWFTHIKVVQQHDNVFALSRDTLYPEGYGQDKLPFYIRSTSNASLVEFGVGAAQVLGLGMWGVDAGPRERVAGDPENSAEVWFDKLP
ncbi:beta-lactamase/transpeptidase-like protein [Calocera viscosa TUFC12733]|uniref:Beta-lactamase/transpeptidase-like protein n=1 Tax=Calocera viscosa (strain TUFC12733) TaxID=1330018 RepID=A0A167SCP6_CALVF|nr:beta-lactamase/transpeptidase-like protein [Calocera viscosa TUFC12733]